MFLMWHVLDVAHVSDVATVQLVGDVAHVGSCRYESGRLPCSWVMGICGRNALLSSARALRTLLCQLGVLIRWGFLVLQVS
jgi:hypothetical protein